MPSEFFAATVVNLLATYLLHSTLLLGSVAIAVWCYAPRSHALREWLWKSAAVIPLVSATLQLAAGVGNPVFSTVWMTAEPQKLAELEPAPICETPAPTADRHVDVERSGSPTDIVAESSSESAIVPAPVLPSTPETPAITALETAPAAEIVADTPTDNEREAIQSPAHAVAEVSTTVPVPATLSATKERESSLPHRLVTWAAWLVACVAATGLLRMIFTSWLFHRRIRRYFVVTAGPVHRELSWLVQRKTNRREVRLLESDDLGEPISFGVWRPTIVIPRGIETRLPCGEIEALLAHELAHLVRGDTRWLLVGRILRCCLPFQPLNLLACRRWREAAEFQCDDWAAARTGNPLALARCLTSIVEWRLDAAVSPHALHAGGAKSTVSLRIERLVSERVTADRWSRARWRRALIVGALLVTAILCRHGPRSTLLAQLDMQRDDSEQRLGETAELEADSLAEGLRLLNDEVQQLEAELRRVNAMVQEMSASDEVRRLVQQLSVRLADLRRHRRELIRRANLVSTSIDAARRSTGKGLTANDAN